MVRRKIRIWHLVVAMVGVALFFAIVARVIQSSREITESVCTGNLSYLGVELANYRDRHGHLPPTYTVDPNGKAMHSWRTILYREIEPDFAKTYNFSEPWNSQHNIRLARQPPRLFSCSNNQSGRTPFASYVALTKDAQGGPEYIDSHGLGRDVGGGLILIEYTNSQILWTEPRDLSLHEMPSVAPGLDPAGIGVLESDMRAHRFSKAALLRHLGSGTQ